MEKIELKVGVARVDAIGVLRAGSPDGAISTDGLPAEDFTETVASDSSATFPLEEAAISTTFSFSSTLAELASTAGSPVGVGTDAAASGADTEIASGDTCTDCGGLIAPPEIGWAGRAGLKPPMEIWDGIPPMLIPESGGLMVDPKCDPIGERVEE